MEFKKRENHNLSKTYSLTLTMDDLMELELTKADELLIEECSKSEMISDSLLALEIVARRLEEKYAQLKKRSSP